MARLPYREGDWFAVPLRTSGYGTGLVARANRSGVLLGYFFGPVRTSPPKLSDLAALRAAGAVLVGKFGHLGLKEGRWPVLGVMPNWDRTQWPMLRFGRKEELSGRAFAVEYADDDPSRHIRDVRIGVDELRHLPRDGLLGAGAVEIVLTRELTAERLS